MYVFVATMVLTARPTPRTVNVGCAFLVVGETLRLWAAGHLRKTSELIVSGPYRWTRHPLYLGRLLVFTGLCLMASLPYQANLGLMVGGWAIFFGYYLPRKERVEGERLLERHGEAFERYRAAVPRLFPTTSPYPETGAAGWSSERMLRNREHWMAIGVLALWLLMLWIAYARPEGLVTSWLDAS